MNILKKIFGKDFWRVVIPVVGIGSLCFPISPKVTYIEWVIICMLIVIWNDLLEIRDMLKK